MCACTNILLATYVMSTSWCRMTWHAVTSLPSLICRPRAIDPLRRSTTGCFEVRSFPVNKIDNYASIFNWERKIYIPKTMQRIGFWAFILYWTKLTRNLVKGDVVPETTLLWQKTESRQKHPVLQNSDSMLTISALYRSTSNGCVFYQEKEWPCSVHWVKPPI